MNVADDKLLGSIIKTAPDKVENPESISAPLEKLPVNKPEGLKFEEIPPEIIPPLIVQPENPVPPVVSAVPPISEDAGSPGGESVKTGDPAENETEAARGRGRPPGSKTKPKPPEILSASADPEKQLLGVAGMTFDMSTGTLAMILGEEWQPRDKAERDFVVQAIANYYRETGMVEIPPRTALVLVLMAYSIPRFAQPKTKEKVKLTFYWIKTKVAAIFRRKKSNDKPA